MELCQVLGFDDRSLATFGKSLQWLQVSFFGMIGEDDVPFSSGRMILELKDESRIPQVVRAGAGGISIDSRELANLRNPELLSWRIATKRQWQKEQQVIPEWRKSDRHRLIFFFRLLLLQAFFSLLENRSP